jgi:zinc and cadmium transporter
MLMLAHAIIVIIGDRETKRHIWPGCGRGDGGRGGETAPEKEKKEGSGRHAGFLSKIARRLILAGDTFHNLLDGVLVAAAFMTNPQLGIVTALAVFAHEIPQEVGDLAILLQGGFSRARAMTLNLVSSLTSVVGGVLAYYALNTALDLLPYALAQAAARFI